MITEVLIYTLLIVSLGSYSAAFSVRWPIHCFYSWRKEAHEVLGIPFIEKAQASYDETRSYCNHCSHLLSWLDLIPVLSFILLKGQCRHCSCYISYRYIIIELSHLIICLPLVFIYSDFLTLIPHLIIMSALITITVIDVEHHLIPDECCVVILMCAFVSHWMNKTLESSIIAMLLGFSLIYILYKAYIFFRKEEGIGLGDIKLISVLGAWLGLSHLAPLLLCASLTGILYTIAFNKKRFEAVPFGPFLALSGIVVFHL